MKEIKSKREKKKEGKEEKVRKRGRYKISIFPLPENVGKKKQIESRRG